MCDVDILTLIIYIISYCESRGICTKSALKYFFIDSPDDENVFFFFFKLKDVISWNLEKNE